MKNSTATLTLAGIALVLAIGNIVQFKSNGALRDKVAALEENSSGETKKTSIAANEVGGKKKLGESTQGGGERLEALQSKKDAGDSAGDDTFASLADRYAKSVADNPAIQKQMVAQVEAQLGDVLDDLYETLGLEGEELAHFKGLIAEHWQTQSNATMKFMSAMGDAEKHGEVKAEFIQKREETDARIAEFLNDEEDFDYYNDYREQIPDRMEVAQYQDALEAGDQALTAEQEAQLISAMAEERKSSGLGDINDPANWEPEFNEQILDEVMGQMSEYHQRVQVRAGGILSQEQVKTMAEAQDNIRQQQELGMRFGLQMMEAMKPKTEAE